MLPKQDRRPLFPALLSAVLAAGLAMTVPVAHAQYSGGSDDDADELEDKPKNSTPRGSAAAASERARERRQRQAEESSKAPANYPLATRAEPKGNASKKYEKTLREIIADYEAKNFEAVMAKAATIGDDANGYDKSFAYQAAATSAAELKQHDKAIEFFQKAIDANGLDNNGHYASMFNLAVLHYELKDYAAALAAVDRFLTETKSDKIEAVATKAFALDKLDRSKEAAALYETVLKAKPDDPTVMRNAVALHTRAGNTQRASELTGTMRKTIAPKTQDEYRSMYVPLIQTGDTAEALKMIDEGIAKGVIKPNPQLAKDYAAIAYKAFSVDDFETAMDMYRRADAIATDGSHALNLARILFMDQKFDEAKRTAQRALDKGVDKPEEARKIISMSSK